MEKAKEEKKENKKISEEEIQNSNKIFDKLMKGEPITENIETERGLFVIKFPQNKDNIAIARRKVELFGDINITKISKTDLAMIEIIASLDVCIVEYPEWWDGAEKCPFYNLLGDIYGRLLRFTTEIHEILQYCDVGKTIPKINGEPEAKAMGRNIFPSFAKR